jgi:hypothetical protein
LFQLHHVSAQKQGKLYADRVPRKVPGCLFSFQAHDKLLLLLLLEKRGRCCRLQKKKKKKKKKTGVFSCDLSPSTGRTGGVSVRYQRFDQTKPNL